MSETNAKEKIFEAAMEEFSKNGYLQASTNRIMKEAGVSKGLIFHYYGSKKELYLACVSYGLEVVKKAYADKLDPAESDLFKKLMMATDAKFYLFHEYPEIIRIFLDVDTLGKEGLLPEAVEVVQAYRSEIMELFWKNLDTSRFKKKFDKKKILEYIMTFFDSYSNRYYQQGMNFEQAKGVLDTFKNDAEDIKEFIMYGVYEA